VDIPSTDTNTAAQEMLVEGVDISKASLLALSDDDPPPELDEELCAFPRDAVLGVDGVECGRELLVRHLRVQVFG